MSFLRLRSDRAFQVRFLLLVSLLGLLLLGGGASRPDTLSLLYVRPAALLFIVGVAILPGAIEWRVVRTPLLFLAALALIIVAQLIPLPPDLWQSMPGHQRYSAASRFLGGEAPWRPLSLTPDLTLNSLLALLPPMAVLVGYAAIRSDQRRNLVPVLLVGIIASGIMGVLQAGGGSDSPFYTYRVSSFGNPAGFFANRNHQAVFLAFGFPLLSVWTQMPTQNRLWHRRRNFLAIGAAFFLFAMTLVTGSRAGIAVAALMMVAAAFLGRNSLFRRWRRSSWKRVSLLTFAGVLSALVLAISVSGRAVSVQRFFIPELMAKDPRFTKLPTVVSIVKDFFPFGTGFGSFDPVFRGYEPDHLLSRAYLNHAHNDPVELFMTGGLPAALLLGGFLVWLALSGWRLQHKDSQARQGRTLAVASLAMVIATLLASLVDYPLRTPLMAATFAMACAWLADFNHGRQHRPQAG
jgi:O-antigen ligase